MMKEFAKNHEEAQLNIIRDLCRIPAPSFGERRRAEYCKTYFESIGAEGVYIDEINKNISVGEQIGNAKIFYKDFTLDTI